MREKSQTRWDTYYCIDADWVDKWSKYVNEKDESKLRPPGPVNNDQLMTDLRKVVNRYVSDSSGEMSEGEEEEEYVE